MTRKFQLSLTLLLLSFGLKGQVPARFQAKWDSLISVYKYRLAEVNISGSSIAFIENGKIIAQELYGHQDKDTKDPITMNTIYNWGSCTKPFAAIAVMQLRDKGLLRLEEPVSKYIPEFKQVKNIYDKEITISHLLTHTSGLPRFSATTRLKDGVFYEAGDWDTFQNAFVETKLTSEPGSKYSYSNMGYDLLGKLIENITHIPFTQYVTTNVLEPLQMESSYFDLTPVHLEKYRSNNYLGHKKKLYSAGKDYVEGIANPSGGLNASLPDMVKFMNFLYRLEGEEFSYEKVLKQSTLEEMFRPQNLMHGKGKHSNHTHYLGIGFNMVNPESFLIIGHEGQSRGFLSSIWVNIETKTGYLLAWNTSHRLPVKKDDKLFHELNEAVYNSVFPVFKK